jgi:hypothetical protein
MNVRFAALLFVSLLSPSVHAQRLSPGDIKILDAARAKYYQLGRHGVGSFTCTITFDSLRLRIPDSQQAEPQRKLLQSTHLTLKVTPDGATLDHKYPTGMDEAAQQQVQPLVDNLGLLLQNTMPSWSRRSFFGPLPVFDNQVFSLTATPDGYLVIIQGPQQPILFQMNRDYLLTRVTTVDGKHDSRLTFAQTLEGWVLSREEGTDTLARGQTVDAENDIETTVVGAYRLPRSMHLHTNQNIDVRFTLTDCSVAKPDPLIVKPAHP